MKKVIGFWRGNEGASSLAKVTEELLQKPKSTIHPSLSFLNKFSTFTTKERNEEENIEETKKTGDLTLKSLVLFKNYEKTCDKEKDEKKSKLKISLKKTIPKTEGIAATSTACGAIVSSGTGMFLRILRNFKLPI